MTMLRTALFLSLLAMTAGSPTAQGRSPPPRMMANVYLLAQAGAILDVCVASPEFPTFPDQKVRELTALSTRLAELIRSVGTHYGDGGLNAVYESTKAEIASDPKLKFHVKGNLRNCGDRLMGEMKAYVAENETLINQYLNRPRAKSP